MLEAVRKTVEFLAFRRRDYQLTFGGLAGQNVLADLSKFCRADSTCFNDDARKHALAEGRREVWLRIQSHLRLTSEQLYALYSGSNFKPEDGQ